MGLKLEVGKYYTDANGEKRGPAWSDGKPGLYPWCVPSSAGDHWYGEDGKSCIGAAYDIIALWQDAPTGPVRTVTRKEIVYGVHGDVEIVEYDTHQGGIGIYINATMNAARIRAAANSMIAVADALEDN